MKPDLIDRFMAIVDSETLHAAIEWMVKEGYKDAENENELAFVKKCLKAHKALKGVMKACGSRWADSK